MSVCAHDPHCPGYGPRHEQQAPPRHQPWMGVLDGTPRQKTETNPGKDRSLSGKARRRARREARR